MYLIDINVSAEIDEYPALRFQDIRKKPKCHGRTHVRSDGQMDAWIDGQRETVYPITKKVWWAYNYIICYML